MAKIWRILPILLLALSFAAIPQGALAQPDRAVGQGQSNDEKMAQGVLLKVDIENLTITIKSAAGDEIQFTYNSDTKVEGTTNGVQGLSTKAGTRLAIHYKQDSDEKLATRIEILK